MFCFVLLRCSFCCQVWAWGYRSGYMRDLGRQRTTSFRDLRLMGFYSTLVLDDIYTFVYLPPILNYLIPTYTIAFSFILQMDAK